MEVGAQVDGLGLGPRVPLLVTTADHALLQTRWVEEFLAACPASADVAAALARRDRVQAAVPDTRRTWLRFADGDFSGCNLFLMARPASAGKGRGASPRAARRDPVAERSSDEGGGGPDPGGGGP